VLGASRPEPQSSPPSGNAPSRADTAADAARLAKGAALARFKDKIRAFAA